MFFVDTHHEVEINWNICTFLASFEPRSFIELRVLDYCVAFWAIEIGNWRLQKDVWTWHQICRCSAHWAAAFAWWNWFMSLRLYGPPDPKGKQSSMSKSFWEHQVFEHLTRHGPLLAIQGRGGSEKAQWWEALCEAAGQQVRTQEAWARIIQSPVVVRRRWHGVLLWWALPDWRLWWLTRLAWPMPTMMGSPDLAGRLIAKPWTPALALSLELSDAKTEGNQKV